MKPSLLLPLLATVAACPIGPRAGSFPAAQSPRGIQADIRLVRQKTAVRGELLEVRDSTLLMLRDGARVTSVPIRAIRLGSFDRQGQLIDGGRLSQGNREKLRLMSRFPASLRAEVLAQLLAAYGQTEPDQVVQP